MTELHINLSKKASFAEWFLIFVPFVLTVVFLLLYSTTILGTYVSLVFLIGLYAVILFILVVVLVFTGLASKLRWQTKKYIVTQDRIIAIDGIIGQRQRIYNLKGITSMQLQQTPLMKLLDSGVITFSFMGGGAINLRNINSPTKHMTLIQEILDKGFIEEAE